MTLDSLDSSLQKELEKLQEKGLSKSPERIITGYIPARGVHGPRYTLKGSDQQYLRMNSNSYLGLSHHPEILQAADKATHEFGAGPGAVRFIDGTYTYHAELEKRIATFMSKPAAKIFNSAYTANCGLALAIGSAKTHWIGDQLNHNSIIRAMRIAGVPKTNKSIFRHSDMEDLVRCLEEVPDDIERVIIIFDGLYSMRGDSAPMAEIEKIASHYTQKFKDGVITVVDDSHGIGAYGASGRGTSELCSASADIIVGTFGKAFGVNGGFICASPTVIETIRQKADTYIYTNPLSVADCAAALAAVDICDSGEGQKRLMALQQRQQQFRQGLFALGKESIPGEHPVIPLMVRDTRATHNLVTALLSYGILAVGLTTPVVPQGDESIRFQMNAAHTQDDIASVLNILEKH